jgi:hypothetical protein
MPSTPPDLAYLKAYNASAQPFPLEAHDPRYVHIYDLPGVEDPVEMLFNQILLAPTATSAHLFSGHLGSGKSTELRRLAQKLRDNNYIALYLDLIDSSNDTTGDMRSYIDRSQPVDPTQFLLGVAAAITDSAVDNNWVPASVSHRSLGDWVKKTINAIDAKAAATLGPAEVSINIGQLIGSDESFRSKLRDLLRGSEDRFQREVLTYIADLAEKMRLVKPTTAGIVVLVDSLEKVRDASSSDSTRPVMQSLRELFTQHSKALHLPGFAAVYTVSPYLPAYEHAALGQLFAGTVSALSSVRIDQEPSVSALADAVKLRAPDKDWQRLFGNEAVLVEVVKMSGGHLRNLMLGVRELLARAVSARDLPVGDRELHLAKYAIERSLKPVLLADAKWLKQVQLTRRVPLEADDDLDRFARLLDTGLLLAYRNGEDWYQPHPLILNEIERLLGGE